MTGILMFWVGFSFGFGGAVLISAIAIREALKLPSVRRRLLREREGRNK